MEVLEQQERDAECARSIETGQRAEAGLIERSVNRRPDAALSAVRRRRRLGGFRGLSQRRDRLSALCAAQARRLSEDLRQSRSSGHCPVDALEPVLNRPNQIEIHEHDRAPRNHRLVGLHHVRLAAWIPALVRGFDALRRPGRVRYSPLDHAQVQSVAGPERVTIRGPRHASCRGEQRRVRRHPAAELPVAGDARVVDARRLGTACRLLVGGDLAWRRDARLVLSLHLSMVEFASSNSRRGAELVRTQRPGVPVFSQSPPAAPRQRARELWNLVSVDRLRVLHLAPPETESARSNQEKTGSNSLRHQRPQRTPSEWSPSAVKWFRREPALHGPLRAAMARSSPSALLGFESPLE